ncbi:MAG: HK97 gp10 family phage protein [Pseudonocardiaceae bacterium]
MAADAVEGMPQLRAALAKLRKDIHQGVTEGIADSAEAIRNRYRAGVNVDTGDLRSGVAVRPINGGAGAEIGVFDDSLYYAAYQEFGTSSIAANPALTSAAEVERVKFPQRIAAKVEKRIK